MKSLPILLHVNYYSLGYIELSPVHPWKHAKITSGRHLILMICSCSLHLSLTPAFLTPGICFSLMSCLPLLPPSLCSPDMTSLCLHCVFLSVSSDFRFSLSVPFSAALCCSVPLPCQPPCRPGKKNKNSDASQTCSSALPLSEKWPPARRGISRSQVETLHCHRIKL